jgi:cell division septation protein DedD
LRALFLMLLLANLLFAAWAFWVAPRPAGAGYPTAAAGKGAIQLLREVPAQPPLPTAGTATVALDDADLACVSAGPFLDRSAADQAAAQLGDLGFSVRQREAREPVPVGTWLRLEGLATPEDASNAQASLQAVGLSDAYVLTEEGIGTVVSVGVYADADKAASAADAVRAAGFEPVYAARLREADVTWLEVDRQANGGLPAMEQLQATAPGRSSSLQLRPCPEAESSAEDAATFATGGPP